MSLDYRKKIIQGQVSLALGAIDQLRPALQRLDSELYAVRYPADEDMAEAALIETEVDELYQAIGNIYDNLSRLTHKLHLAKEAVK